MVNSNVTNREGIPVGGVVGFLQSLYYYAYEHNPTEIIVIWDGKGGSTKRKLLFENYKASRKVYADATKITRWARLSNDFFVIRNQEEEDALRKMQLKKLNYMLSLLPIKNISIDGVEADDVIADIVTKNKNNFKNLSLIVSTDNDFWQLLQYKNVQIFSRVKKGFVTLNDIYERYGCSPENLPITRSILGDKSDEIAGIKGVGIKTLYKTMPFLTNRREYCVEKFCELLLKELEDEIAKPAKTANKLKIKTFFSVLEQKDVLELNYLLCKLDSGILNELLNYKQKQQLEYLLKDEALEYRLVEFLDVVIRDDLKLRIETLMFENEMQKLWVHNQHHLRGSQNAE